eukprot:6291466-Pyramimonas_sp.AAC.1
MSDRSQQTWPRHSVQRDIGECCNLYIPIIRVPGSYSRAHILRPARALEGLHRFFCRARRRPDAAH